MKTQHFLALTFITGITLFNLPFPIPSILAQGTAFTYQGRLNDGAVPANGSYDLRFALYDAATAGTQQGGSLTNSATAVTNGLFAVTLDFGAQFRGANRWLEIAARTNGLGSFFTLTPRQPLLPAPYAITAANANAVSAANISGTLSGTQLPANVVTNNATAVTLTGTFAGSFGVFSNLNLASSPLSANRLRFTDNSGSEQIFLHANRNMDLETVNDGTDWVGHDFIKVVDHDYTFHARHDSMTSVDNNQSLTVGASLSESVGAGSTTTIGGDQSLSVGGHLNSDVILDAVETFESNLTLNTSKAVSMTAGSTLSTLVGGNMSLTVGNLLSITAGSNLSMSAGRNASIAPVANVGIGTSTPQTKVHIYSDDNPTILRVQSTGTPGFGRLEFLSNPQGDINEWRPGFIQSLDAGNFTGGLGFYVNGTTSANKFSTNEVMRIQNGRVGIGTTAPGALLQVGNATCNGSSWANASDRNAKEHFQAIDPQQVLDKVAALPVTRWNYKTDQASEHIGPMAQDFYAAFAVGPDDKHITTVDEGGVALAAIQGLNEKLEARSRRLESENAELRQRLEKLERILGSPGPR